MPAGSIYAESMRRLYGLALIVFLGACGSGGNGGNDANGGGDTPEPQPPPAVTQPTDVPREPRPKEPPSYWIRYDADERLRLNEIQMKGSHNSYHLRPLDNTDPQWLYDLPTLTDQLDKFGVRAVELDLHYYAGEIWAYHLAGDDPRSTCPRLADCLKELRTWSLAHPGHQPLIVYVEPRDEEDSLKLIDHLGELEQTLVDGWPREKVFTPDDFVQKYADVQSAMHAKGWPTLGQLRGKTIFVLLSFGDLPYKYAFDGNGLWGRRMFVTATDTAWRHAGFLAMDEPLVQKDQIKAAVATGFMVRTRADDLPGRGSDFWYKRNAAFESGAQIVLTDYPDPNYIPGYSSDLPGGTPSRCNPITAPREPADACTSLLIENPQLLEYPEGIEVITTP